VTVRDGVLASWTVTVRDAVPATDGVPATKHPVSVSPAGKFPTVMLHEYGAVPPVALIVALYGVFTRPLGSVPRVSCAVEGAMVIVTGPVAVPAGEEESVTVTVSVEVPEVVGVPETTHPFAVKPAGSVPAMVH
jgi:hypothetical protein